MLDFAQGYILKVRSPDQENSNLAQQDNMAPDAVSGDQWLFQVVPPDLGWGDSCHDNELWCYTQKGRWTCN
jgi:hypothetical protein